MCEKDDKESAHQFIRDKSASQKNVQMWRNSLGSWNKYTLRRIEFVYVIYLMYIVDIEHYLEIETSDVSTWQSASRKRRCVLRCVFVC